MEQVRKNLSEIGHRALVDGVTTAVTSHGRPFFTISPPGGHMSLAHIDAQLREAITNGDDARISELADEVERAGLPLLAADLRRRRSAGLASLLGGE